MMTRILLSILALYRRWLSPALHSLSPDRCKFVPTCSEYAQEAITVYGPFKGSALAIGRLLRCHPFGRGGFDPVPLAAASRPLPHEPLP
jgi:putative membrane protein insertion efficiency factor